MLRFGEDTEGLIEEGGDTELSTVAIVDDDFPLAVLSLDCKSVEAVVRKLALDRRRSSLKIDITYPFQFFVRLSVALLSVTVAVTVAVTVTVMVSVCLLRSRNNFGCFSRVKCWETNRIESRLGMQAEHRGAKKRETLRQRRWWLGENGTASVDYRYSAVR